MPLMPEQAAACREWQGKGAHYNVHHAWQARRHFVICTCGLARAHYNGTTGTVGLPALLPVLVHKSPPITPRPRSPVANARLNRLGTQVVVAGLTPAGFGARGGGKDIRSVVGLHHPSSGGRQQDGRDVRDMRFPAGPPHRHPLWDLQRERSESRRERGARCLEHTHGASVRPPRPTAGEARARPREAPATMPRPPSAVRRSRRAPLHTGSKICAVAMGRTSRLTSADMTRLASGGEPESGGVWWKEDWRYRREKVGEATPMREGLGNEA
ncbi:hypothetical protein DFH08DRAFT_817534 [Mycena albidolilacea]|uniref:Uncharacterized protein n=1 Tax=Mycena albidolilacea TaxID=1033008 RepID=A0AAD7EHD2_9AGAR|nr:hypothetical protein DFH08DRAFT_817534 [Mycena albidolilacea]